MGAADSGTPDCVCHSRGRHMCVRHRRAIPDRRRATVTAPSVMTAWKRVGACIGQVLHPHFLREEEIALLPLGLLAPLAAGGEPPGAAEVLAMTDALRTELPQMVAEHVKIRAAVEALRAAVRADHQPRFEELADQLALHARMEEEVLYPAAVLVGDILRARSTPRRFPFDKPEQKP